MPRGSREIALELLSLLQRAPRLRVEYVQSKFQSAEGFWSYLPADARDAGAAEAMARLSVLANLPEWETPLRA